MIKEGEYEDYGGDAQDPGALGGGSERGEPPGTESRPCSRYSPHRRDLYLRDMPVVQVMEDGRYLPEAAKMLALAIIGQALKDWRWGPPEAWDELRSFFTSEWFQTLCDWAELDMPRVLARIRKLRPGE